MAVTEEKKVVAVTKEKKEKAVIEQKEIEQKEMATTTEKAVIKQKEIKQKEMATTTTAATPTPISSSNQQTGPVAQIAHTIDNLAGATVAAAVDAVSASVPNMHEQHDKAATLAAKGKAAHHEKLSWHEKKLLANAQNVNNVKAIDVKSDEAAVITDTMVTDTVGNSGDGPYVPTTQEAPEHHSGVDEDIWQLEQHEVDNTDHHQQHQQQQHQPRKPTSTADSIGNCIFFGLAFTFLAWFVGVSLLNTDAGKQLAKGISTNASALTGSARLGSKALGNARGGLHRAASGDAYHLA